MIETPTIQANPAHDPEKVDVLLEKLKSLKLGLSGRIAALVETPEPHRHVERDHVQVVVGRGFAGDHERKSYYRGELVPGRQVSAISIEVLRVFGVDPVVPGDNLITEGVDLGILEEGDFVHAGEVLLVRSDRAHRPCSTFRNRTSPEAFVAVSRDRYRGALFNVVEGGVMHTGDSVRIIRA